LHHSYGLLQLIINSRHHPSGGAHPQLKIDNTMKRLPILSKAQTLILFLALIVPLSAMESLSVVGVNIFTAIATLTFLFLLNTIRPVTAMIIIMNYLTTLNFAGTAALNSGNERLIFNAIAALVLASGFSFIARDFQLRHKKKAQEQG